MTSRNFVGTHWTYPDLTEKRQAEGGRRLHSSEPRLSTADRPLVTVITVCWNSAKTIEQSIQSVLNQTYDNIEYLIIDGGSEDATVEILETYEKRLEYYVSEPDGGIYKAMNKGLELARGDYILLLNSDDWYEPDAVERLVAAALFSGCDFVGCLARYVRDDGSSSVLPSMTYNKSVLLRMPLRHETMLIPADLYDRIGPYNPDFPIIADYEYTIRLYRAGATYFEVDAPLLNFRTSGVSNTAMPQLHDEHRRLLAATFPFLNAQEVETLGDHSKTGPQHFIDVAEAHVDQPEFVLAAAAMIEDFSNVWNGHWSSRAPNTVQQNHRDSYPEVSVIVPAYKAAPFVADCVAGVLAQGIAALEIIFVDDCSPDDTFATIQSLAETDDRVRAIRNQTNLGPGGSRNVGIRAARGDYVFFLDADDRLPEGALRALLTAARKYGNPITRGAFEVDRIIHGQHHRGIKYPCGLSNRTVGQTSLAEMPELLATTEGHWAALYERNFVECVLYPDDLWMGEDSIFLIKAYEAAPGITLIPTPVYVYQDNADSAMNTYDFRKYMNEIAWRTRAWWLLIAAGHRTRAEYFLFDYWGEETFDRIDEALSEEEKQTFLATLHAAFVRAGAEGDAFFAQSPLRKRIGNRLAEAGLIAPLPAPLKIAMLTTSDHGGAGIASIRCMAGIRDAGLESFGICMFKNSTGRNVFAAPLLGEAAQLQARGDYAALWDLWWDAVAYPKEGAQGTSARELFSRPNSLLDAAALGRDLATVDIVHLHWTAGLLDFDNIDKLLTDRPVVWTLHDMNPFTGGCHYSEGCTNYRSGCENCPLMPEGSTVAQEIWARKKAAYDKIETLHIVCPSQWLADHARESALFGDREVHVISNLLPVDKFKPVNRVLARQKLGLPLDRRLVLFGADSLDNRRKGGALLSESIAKLRARTPLDGVEGVFFGHATLDLGIPVHNMGYVTDPDRLSLIYAAADVFAFPSLEDNAPQTIAEAMLSGTPAVAFPVGNVPELVQHLDNGYLAAYADTDEFADGLAWALEDANRPEALIRGLRAHISARRHYEPTDAIEDHVALYRRIVQG